MNNNEDEGQAYNLTDCSTSIPRRQQEQDFFCNICEKSLSTKSNLFRHRNSNRHKIKCKEKHITDKDGVQRLKNSSNAAAAKQQDAQDFGVAITKDGNGMLTKEVADNILLDIQQTMIYEARARTPNKKGPVFTGKPSFAEGYLRVWCEDQYTMSWLKKAISTMALPSGGKLSLKKLVDIPKRTRICIVIPDPDGMWKGSDRTDVCRQLAWQNNWAQCERWLVQRVIKHKQSGVMGMVVSVPNDVVPMIIEKRCSLSCLLGAVYIKFQGPGGKLYDEPLEDLTAGETELKISGVQIPGPSKPEMKQLPKTTEKVNVEAVQGPGVSDEEYVAHVKAVEDMLLEPDGEASWQDSVPFI